jgi:hypothetical protein
MEKTGRLSGLGGKKTLLIGVTLLCSLLVGSAAAEDYPATSPPVPATSEFHFVVLGDSQLDDPAQFNRLVDDAARLRPAFVVQVGDMIEGYSLDLDRLRDEWTRFRGQIAPLGDIPFFPVPGNHDLYGPDRRADQALMNLYTQTWNQPLYYHFTYQNSLFLILNSDGIDWENQIDPDQMAWLRKRLDASDAEHIFVFIHRPPALLKEADALHNLLRSYPVRYAFYGHHHHYHFIERDGIRYIMTNASGNTASEHEEVGGFDHVIQVAVREDQVATAVIKADSIVAERAVMPADNYDMFALTRSLVPARVDLVPENSDYRARIPLVNRSERTIRLEISCGSPDGRWAIRPARIEPMELAAGETDHLDLHFATDEDRPTRLLPQCRVEVPFQTGHGQWIRHVRVIDMTIADASTRQSDAPLGH